MESPVLVVLTVGMTNTWSTVTGLAALACAASGGAFLTYSTFTSRALGALPDPAGMAAFQQVNVQAPRSVSFMALVFGPGLLALVLGVHALLDRHRPGSGYVLAGAIVYLVCVVGMTAAFHVPRNDALAALDPLRDAGRWPGWLRAWVLGNHVRTLGGLAAGVLLYLGR